MSPNLIEEIIFDALKDSLLIFAFVFIVHLILSYFENGLSNFLVKRKKSGPIFGSLFGFVGMIIGVPCWAIVVHLITDFINNKKALK